ncbi:hypothetical protein L7F22_029269 [Adiantum nelumboides]|nr:hypothetical protein [Adiantum nelumboides]
MRLCHGVVLMHVSLMGCRVTAHGLEEGLRGAGQTLRFLNLHWQRWFPEELAMEVIWRFCSILEELSRTRGAILAGQGGVSAGSRLGGHNARLPLPESAEPISLPVCGPGKHLHVVLLELLIGRRPNLAISTTATANSGSPNIISIDAKVGNSRERWRVCRRRRHEEVNPNVGIMPLKWRACKRWPA